MRQCQHTCCDQFHPIFRRKRSTCRKQLFVGYRQSTCEQISDQYGDITLFADLPDRYQRLWSLPGLDHGGIYLGLDDDGHRRFVSSRSTADGPTMGDTGGTSLLDDGGYYARGFRAVKRL